jgi:hypothetical protein
MAKGNEVLSMLLPNGGWAIQGNDFDSIVYDEGVKALTKAQFNAGLADYDAWKAEQDANAQAEKAALLVKLGINADEAKLLLS